MIGKAQSGQLAGWHSRSSTYPKLLLNMLLMAEMRCMQPVSPNTSSWLNLNKASHHEVASITPLFRGDGMMSNVKIHFLRD